MAQRRLPRGTLDQAQIVRAALEVVDDCGLDGLTVPRVAGRLGVAPEAVRWHFPRKDVLVAALYEEATRQFNALLPSGGTGAWDRQVTNYWSRYRAVCRDHPALCELAVVRWVALGRHASAARRSYDRIESQLALLMSAGFPSRAAAQGYYALSTFTRGCVLIEHAWALDPATPSVAASARVDLSDLPAMRAAAWHFNPASATDEDFDAGLAFIVDGLRARLPDFLAAS